jgi:hypothetical protein
MLGRLLPFCETEANFRFQKTLSLLEKKVTPILF